MAKIIDYEAELSGGKKTVISTSETTEMRKKSSNRLYQYAKRYKKTNK